MNSNLQTMADSLRSEITEYGRLLELFDEQRRLIMRGAPDGVLRLAGEIQSQVEIVNAERSRRLEAVAAFAAAHGQPATATIRSLLPLCAAEARPLMEELMSNINRLLHSVRRGSRQNFRLLSSTVATNQEILRRLRPESFVSTYSASGRVAVAKFR